jgi:hypothetical protein
MEVHNFNKWNKLDITNFLLSENILIDDKIIVLGSYLKWLSTNMGLFNIDCKPEGLDIPLVQGRKPEGLDIPIINLILTYVYIKENSLKTVDFDQISYYLNYNLNIKSSIEDFTNKKIIAGTIAAACVWKLLQETN